jgi:hypothetical protein
MIMKQSKLAQAVTELYSAGAVLGWNPRRDTDDPTLRFRVFSEFLQENSGVAF